MCVYLKQNVSCEVCFLLFASGVIICVSDSYEFFLIWLWLWPCRNQYLSPVVSQDSKDLSWKLMQARTFKQELSLNPAPCCLCVSHITRKSQFQYWLKEQNLPAYNILLLHWTGCRQSCFKTKKHIPPVIQFILSLILAVQWFSSCVKTIWQWIPGCYFCTGLLL